MYNLTDAQVSLTSVAVSTSLAVVCLAIRSPSPFLSFPLQLSGSAVDTGGPIAIENTGFLYNEFLKYAPIILVGSQAVLTASGNYVNVIDDEILECDFAIKFQNNVDFEANTNFECIALTAATTNAPATNFGTNHRANRLGTNHRAYGGA